MEIFADFWWFWTVKNKANLFVLRAVFCVLLWSPYGLRTGLEKTNPICQRANRCKVLHERHLWKYFAPWGMKKQTQTNPILPSGRFGTRHAVLGIRP
jgi:hypothetical protein